MSNYAVMGNLKIVMDYSKDGKPNWYAIINDSDDKDHRAYSNQDLSGFKNQLSDPTAVVLVDVKGETAIHKSGKNQGQPFIKNAVITRMGDEQPEQPVAQPVAQTPQNNVQDHTRVPDKSGLSREEGMLVVGIWTRGITSGKTAEQVGSYASDALLDYRNKDNGDYDVPF